MDTIAEKLCFYFLENHREKPDTLDKILNVLEQGYLSIDDVVFFKNLLQEEKNKKNTKEFQIYLESILKI